MKNNSEYAAEMAVALIRMSKFIGIDDSARETLSGFLESLDDDQTDEINRICDIESDAFQNAFFKNDAQNSSYVLFDLNLSITKTSDIDISDIFITGPIKRTSVIKGSISDNNSIKFPYKINLFFMSEIDHDKLQAIEKSPFLFKDSELDFSVISKSEISINSKKFI